MIFWEFFISKIIRLLTYLDQGADHATRRSI